MSHTVRCYIVSHTVRGITHLGEGGKNCYSLALSVRISSGSVHLEACTHIERLTADSWHVQFLFENQPVIIVTPNHKLQNLINKFIVN